MKLFKLVFLGIAGVLMSVQVNAESPRHAALAIDKANGFHYGWAYDHATNENAQKRALEECTKRGGTCSVVLSWSGAGCGVYRTINGDVGTAYGWGLAATRAAADKLATKEVLKRSKGKPAPNFVYACNADTTEALKVAKNDTPAGSTTGAASGPGCLVQYGTHVVAAGNDSIAAPAVAEFYSPVYQLAAADCPNYESSPYHSYIMTEFNGQIDFMQVLSKKKNEDKGGKGFQYTQGGYNWLLTKSTPSGTGFKKSISLSASAISPENLKILTANITIPSKQLAQHCLGYVPPNVSPVKIIGDDQCKNWIR